MSKLCSEYFGTHPCLLPRGHSGPHGRNDAPKPPQTSHELVDKIGGCEDRDVAIALLNAYVKVEAAKARRDEAKEIADSIDYGDLNSMLAERVSAAESSLAAALAGLDKIR